VVSFFTIDLLLSKRQVPFKGDSIDTAVVALFCLQEASAIAPSAIKERNFILYELGLKKEKYFSSLANIIFIFALPTKTPRHENSSNPVPVLRPRALIPILYFSIPAEQI
jgi:hypothetical protein